VTISLSAATKKHPCWSTWSISGVHGIHGECDAQVWS